MPGHVPDERLTLADVPGPDAAWDVVRAFGHTFHAYRVAGSLQRVATLTLATHDAWVAGEPLPRDLTRLRLALFHTVRASGDGPPDAETEAWARALVAAIGDDLA